MRQNFLVIYEELAKELSQRPYFVSFQEALCDRTVKVYQKDGVHLTDAGREIIARKLAPVIQERLGP